MNQNYNKKIALGTVQFGSDYGISNTRGKVPATEVSEILRLAKSYELDTLDTALLYGDSEEVIGRSLSEQADLKFNIVSKYTASSKTDAENKIDLSFANLGADSLYGYLIHDFEACESNSEIWDVLVENKKREKIKRIGFSLYYPEQLEKLLNSDIDFDIVQIPYSVFDQRFEPYFKSMKQMDVEIHVRSVFLQGLVFKRASDLDPFFEDVRGRIDTLNSLSSSTSIPVSQLCMNFALLNQNIDRVVVGVDGMENFQDLMKVSEYAEKVIPLMSDLERLRIDNEDIILPFRWPKR